MYPATQRIRIHQQDTLPELETLDISKLGRPWHKLPKSMNDNFDILDARLGIYFLKKLRVNATLESMTFSVDRHFKHAQIFSTSYGNLGFVIDRLLLLNILHDYYGLNKESVHIEPDESMPVTKTEERLQSKLGLELTSLIICKETFGENIEIKMDYSAVINQWPWCITFNLEGYKQGSFSILLDRHHVDQTLANLRSPVSKEHRQQKADSLSPSQLKRLFDSLPVRLNGRLASLNLTVAQIADIKPGDIIPIPLNEPMPVFIGKEQIFEAAIAEDYGKLFFCDIHEKTPEKQYE
ncbi:FliM/FliN family flagellar motor switch protein [Pantoea sp. ACRSH]|uniref:FliM/FliN family flagellar motor switch protein n=1 Tax=unclassified Pantoea TaxID=2630326 RepID=UPI001EF709BE|nr:MULTISPECIES: flagellar motor switch protein FliM [unclassified Pantoea]MCG7365215.1 FliM/FliN family flagellar motor switch protein [Pantoea sp. ACRSH]MCG7395833.1 FliM/FliN family flagellar motor switch protein [Pantoea sp. ACRSC]